MAWQWFPQYLVNPWRHPEVVALERWYAYKESSMLVFAKVVLRWLPIILQAVTAVERLSSKKGAEKRTEAIAFVRELIPMVESAIPREIVDEAAVQDAIGKVIDAIVALGNVVEDIERKRRR